MFTEYDDYLKLDFLVDYWYDEAAGIAAAMLLKFDNDAWRKILEECTSRSVEWRVRCAEVLDLTIHPAATEVLLTLLTSQEDDVVIAAADSLRSKDGVQFPAATVERLKLLSAKGSPPVKSVLSHLFEKIGNR